MVEATVRCRKCRHLILKTSEHPVTNGHGEQLNYDSPAHQGECITLEDRSLLYLSEESLPDFIQNAVTEASWIKGKLKCPQCDARLGSFNFVNRTVCVCGEASVPAVHILHSKVDYLPVGGHIKQPISVPHSSTTGGSSQQEKADSAEPQIQDTVLSELECRMQPLDSLRRVNQGLSSMEDVRPPDQNPIITSDGSQLDRDTLSKSFKESGTILAGNSSLNIATTSNGCVGSDSVLRSSCHPSSNTTAHSSLDDDSASNCHLDSITTSSNLLDDATTAHNNSNDITSAQLYDRGTTNDLQSTAPSTISQVEIATTATGQQNTTTPVNSQLRTNSPSSDYEVLIKTEESQQQNQQQRRQRRKAKELRDLEAVDYEMKRLAENSHQQLSREVQEDEQEESLAGLQNVGQHHSSRFEVLQTLEVEESSTSESKDVPPDLAIPDHLICPVCLDIYYSPFEVKPCGHVFCEPCLRRLAKPKPTETRCPLCRELIGMCQLNRGYIEEVKTKLSDQHQERHREIRKYHDFTSPLPWIPGYHFMNNKPEPRQGIINRVLVRFGLNPLPSPWSIIIEGFMLYLFGVGLAALCHQGTTHKTTASGAEGLPSL